MSLRNQTKTCDYESSIWMVVSSHMCDVFFFFFQAEDGIRDVAVTGVQTCALPIFVIDRTGNALYFSRAPIPSTKGSGPSLFLRHQGIYGFRREMLLQFVKWKPTPLEQAESLEQLRALENGVRVHVLVTKQGSPGVDTPADAEAVAASLHQWPTSPAGRRLQKSRAHR